MQPKPGAAPPGAPPQTGMPGPAMGEEGAAMGEEQPNVSPEEQAQYEQWVTNGMQLIYSKQTLPHVMKLLSGGEKPTEGLANALAMVALRLDESAKEGGTEISGDVKLHGAQELLEQLAELAENAGIHEFSEEELEAAFYLALDIYRSTAQANGTLPVEDLKQDFNELVAADQQGRLDEVLPGISEYAKRAPKPGQQPAAAPEA
jgi:hypothetical protein